MFFPLGGTQSDGHPIVIFFFKWEITGGGTDCVPKAQSSAHPPYCKNEQNKTLKTQLGGHLIVIYIHT
jgi:hypothetical protein